MAHLISPVASQAISITYPSTPYPDPPTYSATSGQAGVEGNTPAENGFRFFTSNFRLILPRGTAPRKGIILLHGSGNDSSTPVELKGWGDYPYALADMGGYALLAVDCGAYSSGNPMGLSAIDAAITYLTTTVLGTPGAKVGLYSHSMGALNATGYARLFPANVAAVFMGAPLLDIDVVHKTIGYTPPWTIPVDAPNAALYKTQIDRSARTNGAFLVPNPNYLAGPSPYDEAYWAANVVAKNWNAVNANPALWRGIGVPIRIVAAEQDPVVPYQMPQWWVSAVDDPDVTMRELVTIPGNAHSPATWGVGDNVGNPSGNSDAAILAAGGLPRYEIRDFFQRTLG